MSENNTNSRDKQSLMLAAGQIAALLVTFIMPVFLTRVLNKSEYGIYSQFNQISQFILAFFSFGFPTTLYYFLPRTDERGKTALLGNTFTALLAGGSIACIMLLLPWSRTFLLGKSELSNYLYWLLPSILLFIPTEIIAPLYVVAKDCRTSVWFPPASIIIKVLAVVVLSLVWGGLQSVFGGILLVDAVIFIFCIYYCRSYTKGVVKRIWFSGKLFKQQLCYVLPFGIAVVLNTLASKLDKLICISYMTAEVYASYTIAFWGIPGIQQIYKAIGDVYLMDMTKAFADNNKTLVLSLFRNMMTKLLSVTIPAVFIVILYAHEIITFIFTDKFADAVPFFRMYIGGMIFLLTGTCLVIRASGQTKYSLYAYGWAAVFTLPLTFVAIKYYGAWGGVLSALASQILPKFFQMLYEMKILHIRGKEYFPWRNIGLIFLISGVMILPFAGLHIWLQLNVFVCGVLAVIYLLLVTAVLLCMDIAAVDRKSAVAVLERIHLYKFAALLDRPSE